MKRPFYIIYHNPNRIGNKDDIGSAVYGLSHGANALGPDILYYKNDFRVLHDTDSPQVVAQAPLLKDYLAELADILHNNPAFNLQLIAFDLKETRKTPYNFADMQKIIRDNFRARIPDVGMIFSTHTNVEFLLHNVAPNLAPNQAIGTDEYDDAILADRSFKGKGVPYVYGFGDTSPNDLYEHIAKAVSMRDSGNSFRFVYPWTIDTDTGLRHYLDLGVDAMITNEPQRLRSLIDEEYSHKFELDGKFGGF